MSRDSRVKIIPRPKDGWREKWGKCAITSKRSYPSRHLATVAARLLPNGGSAYRCRQCGDYHVTHYPARVQRAIGLVLSIGSGP